MYTYVINLDRSTERMDSFRESNAHMPAIERFAAVDGALLDLGELVADGRMTPDLRYTRGALGCAMSHLFFWEAAAGERSVITVCEDDAVFHHDFEKLAESFIAELPDDWDLVLWGWNFDSILLFELMPGVSPALMTTNQELLRKGLRAFQSTSLVPRPFRLRRAYGTVCYTISPKGARRLLDHALPLRPFTIDFPMVNPAFPNNGIDIVMNAAYPSLEAYVSVPPLVVTPNEHAVSTVIERPRPAAG